MFRKESEPRAPADLRKALAAASQKARAVWSDITPVARRDWIQWIESAKRKETRLKRIESACDMLAKGKHSRKELRMLDALPLPPRPNVEQYKKQAKELLKACKSADPQALSAWVTQWLAAQLEIDPALPTVRRAYTAGGIAPPLRPASEAGVKHLGVSD